VIEISRQQWAELRSASAIIGIREAARQFSAGIEESQRNTVEERIRKRAVRQHWHAHSLKVANTRLQLEEHRSQPLQQQRPLPVPNGSAGPAIPAPRMPVESSQPVSAPLTGSELIARRLAHRRERSALFLSRFVVDATRQLSKSKGDLKLSGTANELATTRAKLWPEQSGALQAGDIQVSLDDKGRVAEIHARLVAQLQNVNAAPTE